MSPRRDGGLFGAFELAWDAAHGVPLRFAVYPRGSSTPAIAVTVTHIRYGPVASTRLALVPATGTRIVHVHLPSRSELHSDAKHAAPATGAAAVARAVGFRLAAPSTLAGLHQDEVRSVNLGKSPAALVTYGHGLGTVFVLEQRAASGPRPARRRCRLPRWPERGDTNSIRRSARWCSSPAAASRTRSSGHSRPRRS